MLRIDCGMNCSSKRGLFFDYDKLSRGTPAASVPLDSATKHSFPLSFVNDKGLVLMYKKCSYNFPIILQANIEFELNHLNGKRSEG